MKKSIGLLLLFSLLSLTQIFAQRTIQVLSAVVKDERIAGAEVLIQKNGERTVVGHTNSRGEVTLNPQFADDNEAIIIIKKEGYSTLVAKCPCAGLTYAISPIMKNLDGLRVVLSWGSTPADLDSHLWYTNNHIYWDRQNGTKANLDVDDRDGYGPETITIGERQDGVEYYYGVHDFTNRESPALKALSYSSAKVFVYVGESLVKTYYVPQNMQGNLWTIFKITTRGEIEDINKFSLENGTEAANLRYSLSGTSAVSASIDKDTALKMNRLGTQEYDEKNYQAAIDYYKKAIEIYPDFGQAYGNMALCYKKTDQYAEALWANRKAISLANGNTKNVTQAGAYYNIGRIYEERGEYKKAKDQYEYAKACVDRSAYDEAIVRMNSKLGQ